MLFQNDTVALVTGASRGIGRAAAITLASEGAQVVVNFRKDREGAAETLKLIRERGGNGVMAQADVSDEEQVENLFERVRKKFGRLDVLVNNAGMIRDGYLLMMSEKDFSDVLSVNLGSCFFCTKAAVRLMSAAGRGGSIVNVSSTSGISGQTGQVNYSSSKGAIISFTKTVAKEYCDKRIRVNAVAPGFVDTDMTRRNRALLEKEYLRFIPMKRFGNPSEVANVIAFLASDKASYVTGQCIVTDGGLIM